MAAGSHLDLRLPDLGRFSGEMVKPKTCGGDTRETKKEETESTKTTRNQQSRVLISLSPTWHFGVSEVALLEAVPKGTAPSPVSVAAAMCLEGTNRSEV